MHNLNLMGDENVFNLTSNIKKQIIKKGKFGRRPFLNWSCNVTLKWLNLDKEETLKIKIGNSVCEKYRLIERCIQSMHLDEESLFTCKLLSDNSVFEVIIILLSAIEKPYIFQWSDDEKIESANFYKELGAKLFKENKIDEAFYKFSTALKLTILLDAVLEKDDQDLSINKLRVALYNNLAGCHLRFKNYLSVIKLCSDSISLIPSSKAFYRRALAYIEVKEYDKAESDLIHLLKIEPKNTAALEKYKLVRELDKNNRENYESIVRKMFL